MLSVSSDDRQLYVSDLTGGCVVVLDAQQGKKLREIPLRGEPRGLVLSRKGDTLYVTERGAGSVAVIDTASSTITDRITVDRWPVSIAFAAQTQRLFVGTQDRHRVWAIDVRTGEALAQIDVVREPSSMALTPDERTLVVTNLLPEGQGTDAKLAAAVSLVDTQTFTQRAAVKLPPGSTFVNGVCVDPQGRWAYVVHGLGRFNLPITQLERGWVNTYALSILDVPAARRVATLLLDDLTRGAANPWSVVCSRDGQRLWISHAGTHEISMIDIGEVHRLLEGHVPAELASLKDGREVNIWVRIQENPDLISRLENDLTALNVAGALRRVTTGGQGPKGLALSADETTLFVANYYAGEIAVLDAERGTLERSISLGSQPSAGSARRGEMLFHDAQLAFQRWQSCASCHPNQGRVDGLRWDFLRDGMGNGKDTISLVFVDRTGPLNRRATRESARECARSSVEAGHMIVPTQQQVDDLFAYLQSLRPEPSPHRNADNTLTEGASRGKLIFEGKGDCVRCHPPPYYTDQKSHNVGILSPREPDGLYDTPALIEAYRTAPYLHDGRARTIRDVLTEHNEHGQHGNTQQLTEQEITDLEIYVLSL
jgi:YVTN family beta-propeller protein